MEAKPRQLSRSPGKKSRNVHSEVRVREEYASSVRHRRNSLRMRKNSIDEYRCEVPVPDRTLDLSSR